MQNELQIFERITRSLLDKEQSEPVVTPIPANALWDTLDLKLTDSPIDDAQFEQILKQIVLSTPRTSTRKFFNQLFGGRSPKATLGDLLAVMLNNSMYTYKVAGPQVGVEKAIIKEIVRLIDYPQQADGTIASGGSMSNLIAMLMARDKADPEARQHGITKKLMAYTSQASHYSIAKNASFIGLGRAQVTKIPTNAQGEMSVSALKTQIEQDITNGFTPFFINATAGTTVLGAFDPIKELAALSAQFQMWLHVDGAYCGSVIFSPKYKHLVEGVSEADSFNLNAHKMMGTPLTCSIIVVKDKRYLHDSLSNEAEYLYQTDHDEFNLGKTSLQCGRRNDALKFWSLWKSVGTTGLANMVEKQFELANVAREYITNHPDYTVYSFPDSISICFNYQDIPAKALCTGLYQASELLVGFGAFEDDTFVRMVTINANNSAQDILNFFKTLEAYTAKNKALLKSPTLS